jgi:hypothetical protein
MVRIRCGVFADGSVCAIEMDRQAEAGYLRHAIFHKKRYGWVYNFDENMVTLYVAKGPGGVAPERLGARPFA